MGYFDALTSGQFKTAKDGTKLFYPWGIMGRGYVMRSERDCERFRERFTTVVSIAMVLIVVAGALRWYTAAGTSLIIFALVYIVWTSRVVRGLPVSAEKLSVKDAMEASAHAHGSLSLWVLELVALGFVGLGAFFLIVDPANWAIALLFIVPFGCCAVFFARLLILRE